jgi:hypothetical protein
MSNEELAIAASTICARNGGTNGSPVGPLLHAVDVPADTGLPPVKARLRPRPATIAPFERRRK